MSHFAKVVDGLVTEVIVADQDFINSLPDTNSWVQTSYNTRGGKHYAPNSHTEDDGVALRKNYAGIGDTYDSVRDAFISPRPFASWSLVESTCLWEPPVPYPSDPGDKGYYWDEPTESWKEIT